MIHIDFETYSETDIKKSGSWKYSRDPSTDILCMAFAINDEPVKLWTPTNGVCLNKLFQLINEGSYIMAHNAFFEKCIWWNVAQRRFGFIQVSDSQWRCSAAQVAALGLPRSLKEAADVLEIDNRKDETGRAVMLKLSKPKPSKDNGEVQRFNEIDHPDKFEELYKYCIQDVEVERELSDATRPLHPNELSVWLLDQRINKRGVCVDMEAVKTAIRLKEEISNLTDLRVMELTEGVVGSPSKVKACVEWSNSQGAKLTAFNKGYLESLDKETLPPKVKELVEIRLDSAKTSTAKYEAFLNSADTDCRVRDNYMYHGASTGRWSGKNVQFQNIPRGKIKDMDKAIRDLKAGDIHYIETQYGVGFLEFLSSALRGVIVAPEGKSLYVADFNAIEARGVAWLSGQADLLNDFKTGQKVYEKQAAFTYNKEVEEIGEESIERFVGKQLILACGYGMGHNKFQSFCNAYGIDLDLDFCETAVKAYRRKNHMIVKQWRAQENAAILALRTGKPISESFVTWFTHKKFLYCKLPSGRCLAYFKPRLKNSITSWGEERLQLHAMRQRFEGTRKVWGEQSIYGGLLVENIVQAICRDLVAYSMIQLEKEGYEVTMHSHDEIISEAPTGFSNIKKYEDTMCRLPSWAEGFPIKAKGWKGKHYRK